jgi:hypothetical protein
LNLRDTTGLSRPAKAAYQYMRRLHNSIRNTSGREEFRLKDSTLAKKIGYSLTAVRAARKELREKGLIDWRRSGRSNIYSLPAGAQNHAVYRSDRRNPKVRATESDVRNREALKDSIEEGYSRNTREEVGGGKEGKVGGQSQQGWKKVRLTEADDWVLDTMRSSSHIHFAVNRYSRRFGLEQLKDGLSRIERDADPNSHIAIDADMETSTLSSGQTVVPSRADIDPTEVPSSVQNRPAEKATPARPGPDTACCVCDHDTRVWDGTSWVCANCYSNRSQQRIAPAISPEGKF